VTTKHVPITNQARFTCELRYLPYATTCAEQHENITIAYIITSIIPVACSDLSHLLPNPNLLMHIVLIMRILQPTTIRAIMTPARRQPNQPYIHHVPDTAYPTQSVQSLQLWQSVHPSQFVPVLSQSSPVRQLRASMQIIVKRTAVAFIAVFTVRAGMAVCAGFAVGARVAAGAVFAIGAGMALGMGQLLDLSLLEGEKLTVLAVCAIAIAVALLLGRGEFGGGRKAAHDGYTLVG
jgi:hypothetical protein